MPKCECGYFFSGTDCPVCGEGKGGAKNGNNRNGRVRIKRVSKKRASQEVEYRVVRLEYLNKHPICQVHNCGNKSEQVHHKKGRIGKLLTDKRYFLAVCDACHKYIELHPAWSKAHGYSESRLN